MNALFAAALAMSWLCVGNARAATSEADAVPVRPRYGYWSDGSARWFISSENDLGVVYARSSWAIGYGLPHFLWVGVDAYALSTVEFGQGYAGLRASSPIAQISFGLRGVASYGKPFLPPLTHFDASDVANGGGRSARYASSELSLVAVAPLPHAALLLNFVAVHSLDAPAEQDVYDEPYRIIVANGSYYLTRVGALARILKEQALSAGVLAEFFGHTGRSRSTLRLGPVAALQVTDHVQLLGALTLPVTSADELGLVLGSYAVLGCRYTWASGEPRPALPWEGSVLF